MTAMIEHLGTETSPEYGWEQFASTIAGRPRVRVSRDGGRTYPAGCERPLTAALPSAPAAVLLYDAEGSARCLAADFDVSRGGSAQVDADAAAFAALVEACGGRSFADRSPTGGRHVYVTWSSPVSIADLRPVMYALSALYPSLDIGPMCNPAAGCIRPPGARHRRGGHQTLTTALPEALAAVAVPCGPGVWAALLDRLAPQLDALDEPCADSLGPAEDQASEVAVTAPARRLPSRVARIAATGTYDTDRYASPSEARQAVMTAAAAAGWTLAQVRAEISAGRWPGMAGFYARYRPRTRRNALARDWKKAQAHLERGKSVRNSPTRGLAHTGGPPNDHSARSNEIVEAGDSGEYQWIRSWSNAIRVLERTSRWAGRAGLSVRLVLRALGGMAQVRGTRAIDIGRRSLALRCGLDDSTVGAVLRALRAEDDPVLELLEDNRGELADLYTLRIPDAAVEVAQWARWRAGNITAIHPAFRELGAACALTYETLTGQPSARTAIVRDACLPPSTVAEALRVLAEHGLAERDGDGWRRGPADLDRLADAFGVTEIVAALVRRYQVERAAWRSLLDGHAAVRSSSPAVGVEDHPWPAVLVEPPRAASTTRSTTGATPRAR